MSKSKVPTSHEQPIEVQTLTEGTIEPPGEDIGLVVVLPVYYVTKFKTKKDKTILVNLNTLFTSHYHTRNKIKQHYNAYIIALLTSMQPAKITGKYEIGIRYFYKNIRSDLDNIASAMAKLFLDAAQAYGLVEEDNINHCVRITAEVGDRDKDNPRVEVFIRKIKETNDN